MCQRGRWACDLKHAESRTAALMVECVALFCFNGRQGGGVHVCGGRLQDFKSTCVIWLFGKTFVGDCTLCHLDSTYCSFPKDVVCFSKTFLICALSFPPCLCAHPRACVCMSCQCQPRRESCQSHSIKGDYVVCRCASLCLPNDWLLTFSPCLLPAGGRGGSMDQLPPALLPLSLAEASATAPAPPSTLGPQGGASCWATSLPAVPPALHTFIHAHTVSQHRPRRRCLILSLIHLLDVDTNSCSAHFQAFNSLFSSF